MPSADGVAVTPSGNPFTDHFTSISDVYTILVITEPLTTDCASVPAADVNVTTGVG